MAMKTAAFFVAVVICVARAGAQDDKKAKDEEAKHKIDASGAIKSKDSIGPLIALVQELEAIQETQASPNPGAGGPTSKDAAREDRLLRKRTLLAPCHQALADITGAKPDKPTSAAWIKWWRENQAAFKEKE